MFKLHVVIGLLAAASCGLRGAVILSDTFSYSNGVLQAVSADRWIGHSGPTNQVDVSSGALNLTGTEGQDVNASLTGEPHSTAIGDRLYASFKVKFTLPPSNNGSYFAHFKDSGAGFRARIWTLTNGASSGSFRLGIGSAAGSAPAMIHPTDLKLESEYLVVTRLILSNAVSALWINPASEEATNVVTESGAAIPISSYAFRQAAGIGTMTIDNLLIGTTFLDVIPPPPATSTPPTPLPAQPPAITTHPQNQSAVAGESVVFAIVALGAEPLTYQWRFAGAEIPGATNSTLTLTNVSVRAQGEYQVMASNSFGTATSVAVTLTVIAPEPPPPIAPPAATNVTTAKPPAIKFTNVLENLLRPGDLPANSFSELVVCPGERLTSYVRISDSENHAFSWLINSNDLPSSVRWSVSESTPTNLNGSFTFVPTAAEAGTNYAVILQAIGMGGTNQTAWNIYVPTEPERQVIVTEFLVNPTTVSTAPHFNPLHRTEAAPSPSSNDEFIEIANLSSKALDLLNWTISDSVQVRHRFKDSFTIPSSNAVVIYGGPSSGFLPALDVPAIAANESTFGLGLNNTGGDSILIRNATSNLVGRVVYSDVAANGSLTRYPDSNGGFVAHIMITTNYASPGRQNDGELFRAPNPAAVAPSEVVPIEPAVIVPAPTEPAPTEPAPTEPAPTEPAPAEAGPPVPISAEPNPSKPAPLTVTVSLETSETMLLQWLAEPGRSYTVLRSPSPTGPFVPMAMELVFADQNGQFVDKHWRTRPVSFYRICTP
jgi:hypothetical protein